MLKGVCILRRLSLPFFDDSQHAKLVYFGSRTYIKFSLCVVHAVSK